MPVAEARGYNQFGPPWLGIITSTTAIVYSQPSMRSQPVGPVGRNARLPVLAEVQGSGLSDGETTWYRTTVGYLPSSVVAEYRDPWIAEAVRNNLPLYGKPDVKSGVRRKANAGDLLRVTGMSPGMNGDTNVWWATTEGYVGLDTIQPATGEYAQHWTMPDPREALGGWWGQVTEGARVRADATTKAPIVGHLAAGQRVKVLTEAQGLGVSGNTAWYRIDGGRYAGAFVHSSLVKRIAQPTPNTSAPERMPADRTWINVDRRTGTLTLMKDGNAIFVTYVSLGKAGADTPAGQYSTFGKYRYDDMTSASLPGVKHYYDLPNVPSTQYYKNGGFAIHGTYWHDQFGTVQSQGCVNLTVTDGAYLFDRTKPVVPADENARWASQNSATPVMVLN